MALLVHMLISYYHCNGNFLSKTKQMKKTKVYVIAVAILAIAVLFWLFTEAFHLLSAKSDIAVWAGVLILCACFAIIIKLSITALKKIF